MVLEFDPAKLNIKNIVIEPAIEPVSVVFEASDISDDAKSYAREILQRTMKVSDFEAKVWSWCAVGYHYFFPQELFSIAGKEETRNYLENCIRNTGRGDEFLAPAVALKYLFPERAKTVLSDRESIWESISQAYAIYKEWGDSSYVSALLFSEAAIIVPEKRPVFPEEAIKLQSLEAKAEAELGKMSWSNYFSYITFGKILHPDKDWGITAKVKKGIIKSFKSHIQEDILVFPYMLYEMAVYSASLGIEKDSFSLTPILKDEPTIVSILPEVRKF